MTAFFNENGRSKAHQDLLTMASDYAVPCIRRATEQDMSGLTLPELSALDGFPNVQVIGAEGEVTAVVPFLVSESIRSNVEFWRTPPGTVRFSAQLDRPITGFGYNKTKRKRKPSQGSQDQQEENEREQEQEQEAGAFGSGSNAP